MKATKSDQICFSFFLHYFLEPNPTQFYRYVFDFLHDFLSSTQMNLASNPSSNYEHRDTNHRCEQNHLQKTSQQRTKNANKEKTDRMRGKNRISLKQGKELHPTTQGTMTSRRAEGRTSSFLARRDDQPRRWQTPSYRQETSQGIFTTRHFINIRG